MEKLKEALARIKSGDKPSGRKLLTEYIKKNPTSEMAWMWLSVCLDSSEQKQFCLQKVLSINPQNSNAQKALAELEIPLQPKIEEMISTQPKIETKQQINNIEQKNGYPRSKIGEYVKSVLLPSEKVLAIAKVHWTVFIPSGALTLLAILGTIYSLFPYLGVNSIDSYGDMSVLAMLNFTICGLPFWIFAILGIVRSILRFKTTEFALTNKRLIGKVGIVRRNSLELVLGKVESISVNQGILGRMLDYGTLVISGSGGTHQNFPNIAQPQKLKQKINSTLS